MPRSRRPRPGAPTLKEQQSAETKARLIEAARRLFGEYGYHAVSVTEIARAAGVTHGMINAHFNAKAGLLYALISESNERQIAEAREAAAGPGTVLERIERVVTVFATHDLADPELLAVMQAYFWQWPDETEEENREQVADALTTIREILEAGIAAGELRAGLDLGVAIRAFFAIYTLGLRPAIYDRATVADCVAGIMEQVTLLIQGAHA